jgi:hypothetical protein
MVDKTPSPNVRQMRTAFLSAYATRDWERFLKVWLAYKRATY